MNEKTLNTRLLPREAHHVRQVVDRLICASVSAFRISELLSRSKGPDASPFERYAGIVLQHAGATRLAALPSGCAVMRETENDARPVRLTCTCELDEDDAALIVGVEDALNRLVGIAEMVEDSSLRRAAPAYGIGISALGNSFIPQQAKRRSSFIPVPNIGLAERPEMSYFNELDWRILDNVAAISHSAFQASLLPNLNQTIRGVTCPDGSDWDVRTRLAALFSRLELPLRCSLRYDVCIPAQTVSICLTVPGASSFPPLAFDPTTREPIDVTRQADDARIAYTMRLSCLLAAVAFGSGRRIERAVITATRRDGSPPVFHARFDRDRYVRRTLTAIDAGELGKPAVRFDTAALATLIAPDHLEYVRFDGESHLAWPDDGAATFRIEPHADARELPDDLRDIFHARLISDIDTRHYFGPGSQAITEARIDSDSSVMAAIANLERVVDELEPSTIAPVGNELARPLFCAHPLSRAVVSLLDDDLSVSDQAESFLRGEPAANAISRGDIEYFRIPDALFHAHMGLSDLYERLGDIPGAEAHANRCIALAPTSPSAYFRKADILAQQSRFHEAANVLSEGLRSAVSPRDCALLYYHLALILWNTGRKPQAAAVHVYTASLSGEYAEKARKVVVNLRRQPDSPVIVFASPLAARREMERARIPVAPCDEAKMLIVRAAIGLACANAPCAAAPYAAALATYLPDEPAIVTACRSIIDGVPKDEGSDDQPLRP